MVSCLKEVVVTEGTSSGSFFVGDEGQWDICSRVEFCLTAKAGTSGLGREERQHLAASFHPTTHFSLTCPNPSSQILMSHGLWSDQLWSDHVYRKVVLKGLLLGCEVPEIN